MPLKPGRSKAVISENIHEMVASGHPPRVAVAASLHNADKEKTMKAHHMTPRHEASHNEDHKSAKHHEANVSRMRDEGTPISAAHMSEDHARMKRESHAQPILGSAGAKMHGKHTGE